MDGQSFKAAVEAQPSLNRIGTRVDAMEFVVCWDNPMSLHYRIQVEGLHCRSRNAKCEMWPESRLLGFSKEKKKGQKT